MKVMIARMQLETMPDLSATEARRRILASTGRLRAERERLRPEPMLRRRFLRACRTWATAQEYPDFSLISEGAELAYLEAKALMIARGLPRTARLLEVEAGL